MAILLCFVGFPVACNSISNLFYLFCWRLILIVFNPYFLNIFNFLSIQQCCFCFWDIIILTLFIHTFVCHGFQFIFPTYSCYFSSCLFTFPFYHVRMPILFNIFFVLLFSQWKIIVFSVSLFPVQYNCRI